MLRTRIDDPRPTAVETREAQLNAMDASLEEELPYESEPEDEPSELSDDDDDDDQEDEVMTGAVAEQSVITSWASGSLMFRYQSRI